MTTQSGLHFKPWQMVQTKLLLNFSGHTTHFSFDGQYLTSLTFDKRNDYIDRLMLFLSSKANIYVTPYSKHLINPFIKNIILRNMDLFYFIQNYTNAICMVIKLTQTGHIQETQSCATSPPPIDIFFQRRTCLKKHDTF